MNDDRAVLAQTAFRRGDIDETERLCQELLMDSPSNAPATLLLGMVAVRRKQLDKGIDLLKAALKLSPNDYVATMWLIGALYESAQYVEAIERGKQAHDLWPDEVQVLVGLSHAYMMGSQDIDTSTYYLEKAVKLEPQNPVLLCKLGSAYELLARETEAFSQYERAINAAPKAEEAYSKLGRLFMGHGNYVEAIELCEKGLKVLPDSAQMHLVYAQALRHVREMDLAETHLQKAIALDPKTTLAAAKWLEEDGRFEEAAKLFEKAKDLNTRHGTIYYGIVKSRKVTEDDRPMLKELEAMLNTNLPLQELASVYYALGKAANDLKEYEKAMRHFDEGNALNYKIHLSGKPFDAVKNRKWLDQTMAMASLETMEKYRRLGCESEVPIFIIGMIRSGTTLTEQIIASHPDVGGAGEQRFWVAEAPGLIDLDSQTINEEKFVVARDRYLAVLRSLEPTSRFVTDKMPMNYFVIWLIHLAYPNAKIIHIKRSPLDTALSIYMTDLAKPPEFAHNKKNIVAAYRDYEELMAHFSGLIRERNMMTIQYEDLIADQEHWTRKLLEFCGLPWDDQCLEFYASERQVTTPSRWQVRQPIYKTSIEKWRNFEPWLGEFAELKP
ncbi:MAG TPA: sulfotransferase [Fimbriimonadaceae bacterium]|jgi:tetratricopeptide (TPR) repeat protein